MTDPASPVVTDQVHEMAEKFRQDLSSLLGDVATYLDMMKSHGFAANMGFGVNNAGVVVLNKLEIIIVNRPETAQPIP